MALCQGCHPDLIESAAVTTLGCCSWLLWHCPCVACLGCCSLLLLRRAALPRHWPCRGTVWHRSLVLCLAALTSRMAPNSPRHTVCSPTWGCPSWLSQSHSEASHCQQQHCQQHAELAA